MGAMTEQPPRIATLALVTREVSAQVLGIKPRYHRRLEVEGVLPVARDGASGKGNNALFDLPAVVAAFLAYKVGRRPPSPRDARDQAQADLTRLRLDRERGQLLARDDVERTGAAVLTAVSAKLRSLPSRLVRAGLVPVDGEALVGEAIGEMQGEMQTWPFTAESA
jgi:hypothetical protein